MVILIILGSISLALGFIFLIDKGNLKKIDELLNKTVFVSEGMGYKYSKLIGAVLLILACVLFFVYFARKNG
jgi:hypothetical protein